MTKFTIAAIGLVIFYNLATLFFMVNREVQLKNIDPQVLKQIQEHNLLSSDENLVIFKTLSYFDNSSFLVITNQRLLTSKNWQNKSIKLPDITNVVVTSMFLGFSIVKIQTKEYFFEIEIENKNLDQVIQALQFDPKLIIYKNYTNKPA